MHAIPHWITATVVHNGNQGYNYRISSGLRQHGKLTTTGSAVRKNDKNQVICSYDTNPL